MAWGQTHFLWGEGATATGERSSRAAAGEDLGEEHQDDDFDTNLDSYERRMTIHPDTKH